MKTNYYLSQACLRYSLNAIEIGPTGSGANSLDSIMPSHHKVVIQVPYKLPKSN